MKQEALQQAIILAAGKSTRTMPLTAAKPKALLKAANKTILEHNLDALSGLVKEAVIVIGFEGHLIKQKLGFKHGNINIAYVEQIQQLGTAHALKAAETRAKAKFIVLMGDDLYSKEDIKKCIQHGKCILGQQVEDISLFGSIKEKGKVLTEIVEKSPIAREGLANTGLYVLGKEIFAAIKQLKKSDRGEFDFTMAINNLAQKEKITVEVTENWMPIVYPWSLLDANEKILANLKTLNLGEVEKGATIKGAVQVGKGTVIKAGAYLEGPIVIGENCRIGPNCCIRASTSIGNECVVGNATEIKNSVIMDGSHVAHLSYVGDSVIGENVNFGASTIVANIRHDNNNVKSMVKGQLIDSKRRKLGAIIGDNVHTGIHTTIYPGRKIWPGKTTLPGEIIKKDIE